MLCEARSWPEEKPTLALKLYSVYEILEVSKRHYAEKFKMKGHIVRKL